MFAKQEGNNKPCAIGKENNWSLELCLSLTYSFIICIIAWEIMSFLLHFKKVFTAGENKSLSYNQLKFLICKGYIIKLKLFCISWLELLCSSGGRLSSAKTPLNKINLGQGLCRILLPMWLKLEQDQGWFYRFARAGFVWG